MLCSFYLILFNFELVHVVIQIYMQKLEMVNRKVANEIFNVACTLHLLI